MNNNKFKEIYNHEIPIDLELEWSIIDKKLDKSRKRRPIFWFFRGFILLMLLVPFKFFLLADKQDSQNIDSLSNSFRIDAINDEAIRPFEKNLVNDVPNNDIKLSLNKKEDQRTHFSGSPFISRNEDGKSFQKQNSKTETTTQNHNSKKIQNNQLDTKTFDNIIEEKVRIQYKAIEAKRVIVDKVKSINSLRPTALVCPMKYEMNRFIDVQLPKDKIISKHSLAVNIMGGVGTRTTAIDNNNMSYVALRKSSEKVLESYKLRLAYEYKLNNNWAVSTGIDFSTIVEHLQYKDVVEQNGNASDQIIGTYTDHNGKVESLIGNQDFHRIYNIDISSYNSLNSISIPLSIVYSRRINKLMWSLSTGINQPVLTNYKGKLIDEDKLPYDVNSLNDFKILNALKLNHTIAADFLVSKNISLSAGFLIEYDLNDRIMLNGISHSYISLLGNIGLKYNL